MDLNFGPEAEEFRSEVRAFLAGFLPEDWQGLGAVSADERRPFLTRWRQALLDRGFLVPGWPKQHGGLGLGPVEQSVLSEELVRAGVPQGPLPTDPISILLLGQTLIRWGTPEQQDYFLPRTASGEIRWAQGYSEPAAGSDLFAVRTRADLRDSSWVINGQKVWQTAGLDANWIFLLARTGTVSQRAKGLSFVLVPVEQDGVEVRGIKNMAGETEFAEFFFSDAATAVGHVVGGVGNGAKVALTLLGYERGAGGIAAALSAKLELTRLIELARAAGRNDDQSIRIRIAECWTTVHVLHCLALRTLSAGASGAPPGPESSVTKILVSEYRKRVTEIAVDILGLAALTPTGGKGTMPLGPQPLGADALSSATWVADYLHARPGTIYGGSREIQLNTIGEQVLKLDREPRPAPQEG